MVESRTMTEYTDNILGQPEALNSLLARTDMQLIHELGERTRSGEFDRIILTGMGASLCAAYPAWELLARAGLPAWWLETGALLNSARALITPNTLLWMVSQAGRGPEGRALLGALNGRRPKLVLATTNNPASPLAERADLVLPLHTAQENGVATRTLVNTLAVTQLAALAMAGRDLAPGIEALRRVSDALADYLRRWEQTAETIAELMPHPERLLLVGQGASLAAALDGALVLKEAARANAEGLSAGQFRHGPLELADARLTVLLFHGASPLDPADRQMAQTIIECGARALWVGAGGGGPVPALPTPAAEGIAWPIAQIVPIQLLSLHLARLGGFEAAAFRHLGKMT
jgi:glucosamine--fructose-6-phosphate aminotransferase (isomerizing)